MCYVLLNKVVILFLGTLPAVELASFSIYPRENSAWSTHSHKLFSYSKHGKTCLNK